MCRELRKCIPTVPQYLEEFSNSVSNRNVLILTTQNEKRTNVFKEDKIYLITCKKKKCQIVM